MAKLSLDATRRVPIVVVPPADVLTPSCAHRNVAQLTEWALRLRRNVDERDALPGCALEQAPRLVVQRLVDDDELFVRVGLRKEATEGSLDVMGAPPGHAKAAHEAEIRGRYEFSRREHRPVDVKRWWFGASPAIVSPAPPPQLIDQACHDEHSTLLCCFLDQQVGAVEQSFHAIYYINLARRPERLALCERELAGLRWSNCQRVEAVDSRSLDRAEWVKRAVMTESASLEYSPAILACAASHYLTWLSILESDAPDHAWSLILEDDFRPHPVLRERPDVWNAYFGALPADAGFVFVGSATPIGLTQVATLINPWVARVTGPVFGTHAYAMTKRFVREHVSSYFPLVQALDYFFPKLAPLYAFVPIDDRSWGCRTPDDFYLVDRSVDGAPALPYSGLISVHPSPSDIEAGRERSHPTGAAPPPVPQGGVRMRRGPACRPAWRGRRSTHRS
jgi:hypothetical protein